MFLATAPSEEGAKETAGAAHNPLASLYEGGAPQGAVGVGRQGQCGGKSPQNDLTSPRKSPIIITYSDHAEETCRIRRFFRERAPLAESPSSRRARYSPASRSAEQNFKRSRIPALRGNEARYLQPFRKAFAFCVSAVRGGEACGKVSVCRPHATGGRRQASVLRGTESARIQVVPRFFPPCAIIRSHRAFFILLLS